MEKYRVKWTDENGVLRTEWCDSKEEMLKLVADKVETGKLVTLVTIKKEAE